MKRKWIVILMTLVLAAALTACGGEETTLTGMVVSVDGSVISVVEMDGQMGSMEFAEGERPQMPEGMEDFSGFGPGAFEGTLPEGETLPQWEGGEMPEGMTPPEDMPLPEDGEMPDFGGENGGMWPGAGGFEGEMEATSVDIGDAHISVEIDGGKASGTMADITPGTMVTLTMNGKGEVTYVLVSSQSFFGGSSWQAE